METSETGGSGGLLQIPAVNGQPCLFAHVASVNIVANIAVEVCKQALRTKL